MTRKYWLLSAIVTAAAVTTSVSAQDANQGTELEEIVVTGSYLFTGLDSPSPVVVISGDELVNSAPADLATYFFDNVVQNASRQPSVQTENNFVSQARATRQATINLRALGQENTLILLNGRRTIENPVPNNGGWRSTDINTLVPRIAIARTELLLDGGSALYGSDAVAGVVNSVTRNDFEGFDFAVDSRFFEEDFGAKDITLAALWGAGNDTTHVIVAAEWHETDELLLNVATGDIDSNPNVDPFTGTGLSAESQLSLFERGAPGFGAPPPPEWGDPQCGDPAFGTPLEAFYPSYTADADTLIAAGLDPALADDEEYLSPNPFTNAPGTAPVGADALRTTPPIECARATGFNDDTIIQSDTEQLSIFVAGEHKFSDTLTAKVELNLTRQRFNDRAIWGDEGGRRWVPDRPEALGLPFSFPSARVDPTSVSHPGLAYAQFLDPSFGFFTGSPLIPGMAGCPPGAPCGPPFFQGTPPTPAVPAGYNPLYQRGETLPFRGETDANMETDLWRTAFTLEGEINADWRWKFDATAAYNTVRQNTRDTILENYALAINGLGGPDCNPANLNDPRDPLNDPSRGSVVPGESQCYWYNPLMNNALPDAATNSAYMVGTAVSSTGLANDAVMLDWLTPLRLDIYDAEFYSYDFQVAGFFGSLPGGPVGLAAGAGVRSDTVTRDSDRLVNAGLTAAIGTFNDFSGRQKVNNVYAELALPIHDNVNIQVAARYEDYVDGFSETSPKIAVLWTPTDDLTLRASWGQSFKAPSTIHTQAETFVGGGGRERITIDGTTYGGGGGILGTLRIEPNAALQAQTSDNWSVGFDYNATDNITVGATYIGIEFTDRVANPTFPSTVRSLSCLYTDANGLPITDEVFPAVYPPGDPLAGQPHPQAGEVDPTGFMQWNVYGDPSLGAPLETTGGNKGCMIPSAVGADPFVPIGAGLVGLAVSSPANLGYLNVEALDIRANMFWDTPIGQMSFVPNLSIYTKYEFPRSQLSNADFLCPPSGDPETSTDDVCDGVGRDIGFPETAIQSLPRWSGTFTGGLRFGSQNVRLTARFTDGINIAYGDLTDTQEARFQHDEGLWTLDLNYSWQMSAASGLNLSVRNLFAEEPQANIGRGFFNRNRRTYSVQYTHSFAN